MRYVRDSYSACVYIFELFIIFLIISLLLLSSVSVVRQCATCFLREWLESKVKEREGVIFPFLFKKKFVACSCWFLHCYQLQL